MRPWPSAFGAALALWLGAGVAADQVMSGSPPPATVTDEVAASQALLTNTCAQCHNDRTRAGNLSLASFEVARAGDHVETTEKIIRKLRAGQMPPPGVRRPPDSALQEVAAFLESAVDVRSAREITPSRRTFQRLNRAEYAQSIHDLLALDIDAGDYLPLDEKSANFDNIADAQLLSPTLMQGYLTAAAEISRLAVGDRTATARETTYPVSRWTSQREHVEGAPYGTRGGVSLVHTFPADGDYRFRVSFYHETTGALYGNGRAALHTAEGPEQIEISIDGARAALLDIDRWMSTSDPDGVNLRTEPIRITAGPHRVSAAFIRRLEGPVQDLLSPLEWSIASTSIADAYGFTTLPHLRDLAITGPFDVTGVSETPSRRKIFACHPSAFAPSELRRDRSAFAPSELRRDRSTEPQQVVCARRIVSRLSTQAFRRAVSERDVNALMALYKQGAAEGGFEGGIRLALEGILGSPRFIFRFEELPPNARPGTAYALSAEELASRLSFFLWGTGPDDQLLDAADRGALSTPRGLDQQVRRMLGDGRAGALATRFGSQWLRLQDLDKINPDVRFYPDFDDQLKTAMRHETELVFRHIVLEDRPVLDLFSADYTFVNERLARHYGIPGIVGTEFRKVRYPDDRRRGLFGHASMLTLTSHADRTSPVLRGKWVMEVLMGTPPPPPPPNVPDLEATAEAEDGRLRTVRERLEQHRASAACASCHRMIDPIGLALENFDVTGAWRVKDNGTSVDARSTFYDGTTIDSPETLRQALLNRQLSLVRTFTENLMTYALGRRLDARDLTTVRAVVREAQAEGYRFSSFAAAIARSAAFRMMAVDPSPTTQER
jgi:mono/diheme cytochrome c family protein